MRKSFRYPLQCFAHRGGGTFAPENTLNSLSYGKSQGYKGVEFDVMLSKDEVPFLMHDEVLERTVRNTPFLGSLLCDVNAADLATIDAGSWFDAALTDVRIPTFASVIEYCRDNDVFMNIEIKPCPGHEVRTGQVVAEFTAKYFKPEERLPLFSSFSFEALMAAKEVAPHIPRAYLVDDITEVPSWHAQLLELDAVAFHTNWRHTTDALIQEVKGDGFGFFCYTVNDVDEANRLLARGMDAFCTDRLDLFKAFI